MCSRMEHFRSKNGGNAGVLDDVSGHGAGKEQG